MTTETDLRGRVLALIAEIAPDAAGVELDDDEPLREVLDLDSLDVQNLVAAIADDLGVEIADRDYDVLDTLGSCVTYLREHGAS